MSQPLEQYLKERRKKSGLTQEEIAFLLALSDQARVSEYELSKSRPRLETALAYEVLFGKPLKKLFKGLYEKVERQVHNSAVALLARLKEAGRLTDQKHTFLRHLIDTSVGDLLKEHGRKR